MNHVTQVKRALERLIRAELAEYLWEADTADEADGHEGIETPPPARVWRTDKTELEDYPAIELIATHSSQTVDTHADVYRHRIVVGFTLAGDDQQVLTTQVERYMWAVRRLFNDRMLDPPLGTAPLETGQEQYTLVAQVPKGMEVPFVKGGFLEVFVKTLE